MSPPPFWFGGGKKPPVFSASTKGFGPARCFVGILLLWWLDENDTGKALASNNAEMPTVKNMISMISLFFSPSAYLVLFSAHLVLDGMTDDGPAAF